MQDYSPIRGTIWQCTLLLRAASLLVPKPQRAEWYKEWRAEVWHWLHFLAESGRLNPQTKMELARHCWGAFADAAWHRFNQKKVMRAVEEVPRSARFCLGASFLLLLMVILVTGFAPTIRAGFRPLPFRQPDRLAYLSLQGSFSEYDEENLFVEANEWSKKSQTAEMVAAYSWHSIALTSSNHAIRDIGALVSPDFFELLGSKPILGRTFVAADAAACFNCVVITHRLWKAQFGADPNIAGKTISVDDRPRIVLGVLPENFAFTFPEVSVWQMAHWSTTTKNLADRTGAVLRMREHVSLAQAGQEFKGLAKHSGYSQPQLETFESRAHQGAKLYLFFCGLALFGGIALSSSRLRAAKTRKIKLSSRHIFHWWSFFILKTLLLLALCFVTSLEVTGRISIMLTGSVHPLAGPFSTWLFLVTAMIALSWSLYDQCRRCRFCLKRLSNEASVGTPGYLLLGWWGTELVCSDGHGMLHVPEVKSSWQEFDQWVSLDESWKPLFEPDEPVHTP